MKKPCEVFTGLWLMLTLSEFFNQQISADAKQPCAELYIADLIFAACHKEKRKKRSFRKKRRALL